MEKEKRAWAIRPWPHHIYRMPEFLSEGMAAIGWPALGDLRGCSREQISERLKKLYHYASRRLGQVAGIVDRFVNQIQIGDIVVIPDDDGVYFGTVTSGYTFKPHLATENEGYPHWIGVDYMFDKKPIRRSELPARLYDALKGRQSVFGLPYEDVQYVIDHFDHFRLVDTEVHEMFQGVKKEYIEKLSRGKIPGINSPKFEEAVSKVLSLYFSEKQVQRMPTANSSRGADTDIKVSLPGDFVIRIQVKCYRDDWGELSEEAVEQLRRSMEEGDLGLIVTTGKVSDEARRAAQSDPLRPISIIDGPQFADLVFENLNKLNYEDLWALGFRLAVR